MSETQIPRELVLDTSVAVKFHVPEENHEEARRLQRELEDGAASLLAPGTILPEVFNAFWQKHRRDELSFGEVRQGWELISELPMALYTPEDLMPRAVEIAFETGVIIYDALFLALAEETETVDRHARQVEQPLAPLEEHGLEQRRGSAQKVRRRPPLARVTECGDLLAASLQVPLCGLHPAREQDHALLVQHAHPVKRLADVEAHPVPHRHHPRTLAVTLLGPGILRAVLALTKRLVRESRSAVGGRSPSGAGGRCNGGHAPKSGSYSQAIPDPSGRHRKPTPWPA